MPFRFKQGIEDTNDTVKRGGQLSVCSLVFEQEDQIAAQNEPLLTPLIMAGDSIFSCLVDTKETR